MIINPDFIDHWKTRILANALGELEAVTALLRLWGHCQNRRRWVFDLTAGRLAGICHYNASPEKLWKAMTGDDGWLAKHPSGQWEVLGFREYNHSMIQAWFCKKKPDWLADLESSHDSSDDASCDPSHDQPFDASNDQPPDASNRGEERREEEIRASAQPSASPKPNHAAIAWTPCDGWNGIQPEDRSRWEKAYPACDLERELAAMDDWLRANPAKAHKKAWASFVAKWLARSQERGGGMASAPARRGRWDPPPTLPAPRPDPSIPRLPDSFPEPDGWKALVAKTDTWGGEPWPADGAEWVEMHRDNQLGVIRELARAGCLPAGYREKIENSLPKGVLPR